MNGDNRVEVQTQVYELTADDLKDDGLVASFYTDEARKGFVTEEMVKEIRQAVYRARYRAVWDREMPEDMLKE